MRVIIAVVLACTALAGGPCLITAGLTGIGFVALTGGAAGSMLLLRTAV